MKQRNDRWCLALILLKLALAQNALIREAQGRVVDNLFSFLSRLVGTTDQLLRFQERSVVRNDIRAPDRELFLLLKSGISDLIVYAGTEDGLFVGSHDKAFALYREPGEDNFALDDADMQIHLNSCIDESGNHELCLLEPGALVVQRQCVDGDCDIWKNCAGDQPILCRQYTIEQVTERNGFVPRTNLCLTELGQPSQEEGVVVAYNRSGTIGDCVYPDGVTRVNRTDTGPFAYCDGALCNDTFVGGFYTEHYDPRFRIWYIQTKELLRPNWTPIYLFQTRQLGITYSVPLFRETEQGKEFYGVIGADIVLDDISKFLVDAYSGQDILVAIYVDAPPYNVVGTSTGSKTFRGVLREDPTQTCVNDNDLNCIHTNVPMSTLLDTPDDQLLAAGHELHVQAGFPPGVIVTKAPDESLYVTYTQRFSIANTNWRIIIANAGTRANDDRLVPGTIEFGALVAIASAGFSLCVGFLVALWYRDADPLTCAFVAGGALLNVSSFSLIGFSNGTTCLLRMWSFHLAFSTMMSFLLMQIWRIYNPRPVLSPLCEILYCLPLIMIQVLILLCFTFTHPSQQNIYPELNSDGFFLYHVVCQHSAAFLAVEGTFHSLTVAVGCILAYITRDSGTSRQYLFVISNIALVVVVAILIVAFVDIEENARMLLQGVGVFWMTVFSTAALVVPLFLLQSGLPEDAGFAAGIVVAPELEEENIDDKSSVSATEHVGETTDALEKPRTD